MNVWWFISIVTTSVIISTIINMVMMRSLSEVAANEIKKIIKNLASTIKVVARKDDCSE